MLLLALSGWLAASCSSNVDSASQVILQVRLPDLKENADHGVIVIRERRIVWVGPQQLAPIPPGAAKFKADGLWALGADGRPLRAGQPATLILSRDPAGRHVVRQMRDGQWTP